MEHEVWTENDHIRLSLIRMGVSIVNLTEAVKSMREILERLDVRCQHEADNRLANEGGVFDA